MESVIRMEGNSLKHLIEILRDREVPRGILINTINGIEEELLRMYSRAKDLAKYDECFMSFNDGIVSVIEDLLEL